MEEEQHQLSPYALLGETVMGKTLVGALLGESVMGKTMRRAL